MGNNMLRVDAKSFEQDYEYGRPAALGLQGGFVLGANVHTKAGTTNRTLRIVVGIGSSAVAEDGSGRALGVKIDTYIPLAGPRYRAAVEAIDPAALKGGDVDLDKWANRPIQIDVGEEEDKLQTAHTGIKTLRLRVNSILPATKPSASPLS